MITGWPGSMPASAMAFSSPALSFSRPFSTISPKGRLRLPGIWPERTPGRGSGASPRKRSAGRASTTCAAPDRSAAWIVRGIRDHGVVEGGREGPRRARRLGARSRRAALRLPGRKAAFENRHVARAEGPEGPPAPAAPRTGRRRHRPRSSCPSPMPIAPTPARIVRRRQHVGQGGGACP